MGRRLFAGNVAGGVAWAGFASGEAPRTAVFLARLFSGTGRTVELRFLGVRRRRLTGRGLPPRPLGRGAGATRVIGGGVRRLDPASRVPGSRGGGART